MKLQDTQAQRDLEAVVGEYVSGRKVFTAAHITCEIRTRKSPAGVLPHRGCIAPAVRDVFQGGGMPGYMRSVVPGNVFAYHPVTESVAGVNLAIAASDWVGPVAKEEVVQRSVTKMPKMVHAIDTPDPEVTVEPAKGEGRKYLRRGTVEQGTTASRKWRDGRFVEVPREMLRLAGFKTGQKVSLCQDGTGAILFPNDHFDQKAQVQNSRLSLRLSLKALEPLGIDPGRGDVKFKFDVVGGKNLIYINQ